MQSQRDKIHQAIEDHKRRVAALAAALLTATLGFSAWQNQMEQELRAGHRAMFEAVYGTPLPPEALEQLAQITKFQLEFFGAFAAGVIASLTAGPAATPTLEALTARAEQYVSAYWASYQTAFRQQQIAAGFKYAEWICEDDTSSCADCPAQASRGRQLAESFPMIGSLQCVVNCRCFLTFYTGQVI